MSAHRVIVLFVALGFILADLGASQRRRDYPQAIRGADYDVLHGERIDDPYRWLEDLGSAATREWIRAQDDQTRQHLSGEHYQRLYARIQRLGNVRRMTVPIKRGAKWFYFETDANGSSGRTLMVKASPVTSPRPVLSGTSESVARILAPTADGRLLAYGVTIAGSRWLQLRIVEATSGKHLPDTLEDVHSSMGSVAWLPDGRAFFYVQVDSPVGDRAIAPVRGARVMRHELGTSQSQDVVVLGPRGSERTYAPVVTDDGKFLLITASAGADQQVSVQALAGSGSMTDLFQGRPGQFTYLGAHGGDFWFLTTAGAPRGQIVRINIARPAEWTTVVREPEESEALVHANMVADRLIVSSTRDAAPVFRIHALNGSVERVLELPPLTTVWGPSGGGQGFVGRTGDTEAYYSITGVGDPGSIYRLDPRTGTSELFLRPDYGFRPSDIVGRQVFYTSKDGTRVPMFIAHHRSVDPAAGHPVFMYGYGAFGFSAYPWYQPNVLAWLELGGVYAIPGLRGGGEYGERWHAAAVRARKQVTIDDYVSAAEWLVTHGYTSSKQLVANGGSMSGLVAAAAAVQRPDLFAAVVIDIPALDLLRYDRHTGAASWIPELGSTTSEAEFRALKALSPLHNLKRDVCYPPMLILAGERDEVAVPSHAYKFVAAVQHLQPCANPVYLQVAWGAGHTVGTSNQTSAENWARQLAFATPVVGLKTANDR